MQGTPRVRVEGGKGVGERRFDVMFRVIHTLKQAERSQGEIR